MKLRRRKILKEKINKNEKEGMRKNINNGLKIKEIICMKLRKFENKKIK